MPLVPPVPSSRSCCLPSTTGCGRCGWRRWRRRRRTRWPSWCRCRPGRGCWRWRCRRCRAGPRSCLPSTQGAAGPGGAGAELASGHGGPVGGRADLYGVLCWRWSGLCRARRDVVSPAPQCMVGAGAQVATSPAETCPVGVRTDLDGGAGAAGAAGAERRSVVSQHTGVVVADGASVVVSDAVVCDGDGGPAGAGDLPRRAGEQCRAGAELAGLIVSPAPQVLPAPIAQVWSVRRRRAQPVPGTDCGELKKDLCRCRAGCRVSSPAPQVPSVRWRTRTGGRRNGGPAGGRADLAGVSSEALRRRCSSP